MRCNDFKHLYSESLSQGLQSVTNKIEHDNSHVNLEMQNTEGSGYSVAKPACAILWMSVLAKSSKVQELCGLGMLIMAALSSGLVQSDKVFLETCLEQIALHVLSIM